MSLGLLIVIVLLVLVLIGLFYTPPAPYGYGGKIIAAICALLLFLIAAGVWHP